MIKSIKDINFVWQLQQTYSCYKFLIDCKVFFRSLVMVTIICKSYGKNESRLAIKNTFIYVSTTWHCPSRSSKVFFNFTFIDLVKQFLCALYSDWACMIPFARVSWNIFSDKCNNNLMAMTFLIKLSNVGVSPFECYSFF